MSRKYASPFARRIRAAVPASGQSFARSDCAVRGQRPDQTARDPRVGESLRERSGRAKAAASSKGPWLGQREDILLRAHKATPGSSPVCRCRRTDPDGALIGASGSDTVHQTTPDKRQLSFGHDPRRSPTDCRRSDQLRGVPGNGAAILLLGHNGSCQFIR
jgi:hypothetical protein